MHEWKTLIKPNMMMIMVRKDYFKKYYEARGLVNIKSLKLLIARVVLRGSAFIQMFFRECLFSEDYQMILKFQIYL